MFWQEGNKDESFIIPDDIMDISFNISSPLLPIDNVYLLKTALLQHLPWLTSVNASLFDISVADGNGWQQNKEGFFYPSRRSKLTLRLPKECLDDTNALVGKTLDMGEYTLDIIKSNVAKKLSDGSILFAKTVATHSTNEEEFLKESAKLLLNCGITPRKMMAGLERFIMTDDGLIATRSLMVADLQKAESVHLQEVGISNEKLLGLGVFLLQKGIDAVDAV